MRDGYQVMLISTGGTVIKMAVAGVKRLGRSTQGVIVMRLREGELVSTLAPVVDSSDDSDDGPTGRGATPTAGTDVTAELESAAGRRSGRDADVESDDAPDDIPPTTGRVTPRAGPPFTFTREGVIVRNCIPGWA